MSALTGCCQFSEHKYCASIPAKLEHMGMSTHGNSYVAICINVFASEMTKHFLCVALALAFIRAPNTLKCTDCWLSSFIHNSLPIWLLGSDLQVSESQGVTLDHPGTSELWILSPITIVKMHSVIANIEVIVCGPLKLLWFWMICGVWMLQITHLLSS